MAEDIKTQTSAPKDSLGYEDSPALNYYTAQLAEEYNKSQVPLAETIIKGANPQAEPKAKLDAVDAIKKSTGVDQPQWMNVIQSVLNLNPREVAISLNGGADVPTQAYDMNGNKWTKVFNERKTAQNPLGEFRHYVDKDGKKYSAEEAEKLAGGPIVSTKEIPIAQQNFYKARGIAADKVAAAQAEDWNKTQKLGAVANLNAPVIIDSSNQLEGIYKQLLPFSVDPKTRELLSGIGDMRTGNTKGIRTAADKLREIVNGTAKVNSLEDLKGQTGGFTFGFNLNEKKQLVNADNTQVTTNDIERAANTEQKTSSSDNAVNARKTDLLNRAQIIAAQGSLPNLDLIQMAVNLEYQKALAINAIESSGGIGIAKPSLANEVGDSFSLAFVKNKMNKDYGSLAQMYADQVQQAKATYLGRVPAIGDVEAQIRANPAVMRGKQRSVQEIKDFLDSAKPILDKISTQSQQALVSQPGVTNEAAVPPAAATRQPVAGQPQGSRPPVKPEKQQANNASILSDIFGKPKK